MKGVCNGALVWQLNDCWGVSSWAGIDYYNNFKALHYRTKHFNSPIAVFPVLEDNGIVIKGINDTLRDEEVIFKFVVGDVDKKDFIEKSQKTFLPKGQINDIALIDSKDYPLNDKSYVLLMLYDKLGKEVLRKGIFFNKKASRSLLKDEVKVDIEKNGNKASILVSSPVYKRFVSLRIKGESSPFSDNFFDLYPGESKLIEVETSLSLAEINERFSVTSVSDVEPGFSRLHDKIEMVKIFLIPLNFLSYIYHTFMI
jgi:beta-mannosidase